MTVSDPNGFQFVDLTNRIFPFGHLSDEAGGQNRNSLVWLQSGSPAPVPIDQFVPDWITAILVPVL